MSYIKLCSYRNQIMYFSHSPVSNVNGFPIIHSHREGNCIKLELLINQERKKEVNLPFNILNEQTIDLLMGLNINLTNHEISLYNTRVISFCIKCFSKFLYEGNITDIAHTNIWGKEHMTSINSEIAFYIRQQAINNSNFSPASSSTETNKEEEVNYIHEYNYKPSSYLKHELEEIKKEHREPLYLGAEIEIDKGGRDNNKVMKKCLRIMNSDKGTEETYIYGMHDGSLPEGFEIATMPATLSFHKSLPYKKMFEYLISVGYRSHDTQTCGLHIHINKSFFGETLLKHQLCIAGLSYLINVFWEHMIIIARRDSNKYCRKSNFSNKEYTLLNIFSDISWFGKYSFVNVQHSDTVELRIFKGTLNYDTFINTLEFVSILAHIVKDTDIYDFDLITWEQIYEKFSPELKDYYNERKHKKASCTTYGTITVEDIREPETETAEQHLKAKIKRLKKELKAAKRSNNYLFIIEIQQTLSEVQREYNNLRRRNRQQNAAA